MLIEYFKNNFYNETSCERLGDGFYFPMPNQKYRIDSLEGLNNQILPQYPPSYNAIYLPYVPMRINVCHPDHKDVISSPFSGCRFAKFKYLGGCLLEEITLGGSNGCRDKKFNCSIACRWKKILVAHIDYPHCRNLWHQIKDKSKVFVDFKPMTQQSEIIHFKQMFDLYAPDIYGVISSRNNYGSVIINENKKVVWFDFKQ